MPLYKKGQDEAKSSVSPVLVGLNQVFEDVSSEVTFQLSLHLSSSRATFTMKTPLAPTWKSCPFRCKMLEGVFCTSALDFSVSFCPGWTGRRKPTSWTEVVWWCHSCVLVAKWCGRTGLCCYSSVARGRNRNIPLQARGKGSMIWTFFKLPVWMLFI